MKNLIKKLEKVQISQIKENHVFLDYSVLEKEGKQLGKHLLHQINKVIKKKKYKM